MKNLQNFIDSLIIKYRPLTLGAQATYIPQLAKADPSLFGISIVTCDGQIFTSGDCLHDFTLQSTSKPFVYGMALEDYGRDYIKTKVGVEPTGEAFNSIVELEKQTHRPYNPMINSGAIAIS
ncbi:MAG: glutaminase, partial [Bdellovibrionales bacterium]|nr:glutaminase [Bdellovibrionales bacterium]